MKVINPTPAAGINPLISLLARKGGEIPDFSPGSILKVEVAQKLGSGEFLVVINQQGFLAKTPLPVAVGEKLTVMVESRQPALVLRLLQTPGAAAPELQQHLLAWRLDQHALSKIFQEANLLAKTEGFAELGLLFQDGGLERLIKLINNLVYSGETRGNPLFIKEFMANLGLTWEALLARESAAGRQKTGLGRPLKPSLLTLLRETDSLIGRADLTPQKQLLLKQLQHFLRSSLMAIETLQAVNVYSWEEQNSYILQLPFLSGTEIRLIDLFLARKPAGHGGENQQGWKIFLYLDFDLLGEIGISLTASLPELDCLILTSRREVAEYVTAFLPLLEERLQALGLKPKSLVSRFEADLKEVRRQTLHSYQVNNLDLVNTYA